MPRNLRLNPLLDALRELNLLSLGLNLLRSRMNDVRPRQLRRFFRALDTNHSGVCDIGVGEEYAFEFGGRYCCISCG